MKRENQHAQLRKEELEALDSLESEDAGTFQVASAEEIANRKILKIKRSFSAPLEAAVSITKPSNPFANFSGLVSTSSSNLASSFNPSSMPSISMDPPSTRSSLTDVLNNPGSKVSNVVSGENQDSEYKKKLKKLNSAFDGWISKNIKEQPLAIWKDGAKDYIKHYNILVEKYKDDISAKSSHDSFSNSEPIKFDSSTNVLQSNPYPQSLKLDTSSQSLHSSFPLQSSNNSTIANPISLSNKLEPFKPTAIEDKNKVSGNQFKFSLPAPSTSLGVPSTNQFGLSSKLQFTVPSMTNNFENSKNNLFNPSNLNFGGINPTSFVNQQNLFQKNNVTNDSVKLVAGDDDGDEEGEPMLPPEIVLKNDNDLDTILHDVPCKLFRLDVESNEWKDNGKGNFRITQSNDSSTKKQRMLIRNPIGKIIFNASFFGTMKVAEVKNGLRFSAVVADEIIGKDGKTESKIQMKNFLLKLKDSDKAATLSKMEAGISIA
eukprot:gene4241-6020_t